MIDSEITRRIKTKAFVEEKDLDRSAYEVIRSEINSLNFKVEGLYDRFFGGINGSDGNDKERKG